MKVLLCPAFILHQRPYRENSLLLDMLTEQYGRIHVLARGQKKSKQRGLVQLFQPLLVSWIGHGELHTLTAIEANGPGYTLHAESALCGLYINELIVRLMMVEEGESITYQAYQSVLMALQSTSDNERALRLFEKRLLNQLGYGLQLEQEADTGLKIDTQQRYYYLADSGLYRWQPGIKQPSISGHSIQQLVNETDFDQQSLNEIKLLMRSVINFYLGGRPLQSRQLFQQLKNYSTVE